MQERSLNGLRKQFLRRGAELLKDETRLLEEYIARIRRFHPRCAIILYGSRARGNPFPYSDYNVAIIIEKSTINLKP
ncbi:MAG: nucleotidyltransferase domain-containing protein [Thermoproteales archaeon]|nr:nucleotidyltransferase domain-containing protein [Thermoproteales archaeon]